MTFLRFAATEKKQNKTSLAVLSAFKTFLKMHPTKKEIFSWEKKKKVNFILYDTPKDKTTKLGDKSQEKLPCVT